MRAWIISKPNPFKSQPVSSKLQRNISSLFDYPQCDRISVLQPSRFYPSPSGCNNAKLCEILMSGNLFIWKKKLATFGYVGVFSLTKCKCISENFKLVGQWQLNTFRCPTNHNKEGCWRYRSGEWGDRSAEWKIWNKIVWRLVDIEVSSAKTEVCDVKKAICC